MGDICTDIGFPAKIDDFPPKLAGFDPLSLLVSPVVIVKTGVIRIGHVKPTHIPHRAWRSDVWRGTGQTQLCKTSL